MFLLNLLVAASGTVAGYQERPNIIVFLVDDMGLMDTSVPFLTDGSGNRVRHSLNNWYHTPNMERMAEQGICFSTFYAQSVSSPSRASLLTGQNATRHRTTNWINAESNNRTPFGPPDWNWKGLTKDIPTMPKVPKSPSNHFENFLLACNGIEKTRSPFEINGVLSQVFSLGVMAQRLNTQLFFDPRTKQITNNEFANAMLAGLPPRKGWDEFYKL